MKTAHRIAESINSAIDLIIGEHLKTPVEHVLQNDSSTYLYYIQAARQ